MFEQSIKNAEFHESMAAVNCDFSNWKLRIVKNRIRKIESEPGN